MTNQFNSLIFDIRKLQLKADKSLTSVLKAKTDWTTFTREEKEAVQTSLLVSQLSKGLLETNILDEEGGLLTETLTKIKELEKVTIHFQSRYTGPLES